MAESVITQNVLETIFADPQNALSNVPVPVLQCLQIKTLAPQQGFDSDRYRIIVSDMHRYGFAMLATQANHVLHEGKLKKNSILRVRQYQPNAVKGRNILIILDLEVLEGFPDVKLGDPVASDAKAAEPSAAATTTIPGQGFYGAKKEESTTPNLQHVPPAAVANRNHGSTNIFPIDAVSSYSHKWTIKARVTNKSDIRRWQKPSSEGKLFSVNLLDDSGEIKMTGFNEQVDQFYDMFQEGAVYYISTPCKVAFAKKQFTNLKHDFELTLETGTVVEKAEDQTDVPQVRYNFCSLQELQAVDKDATVDIVGVLQECGEINEIKSKTTGKPYEKRDLTMVDDSGYRIRITIWGKLAAAFDASLESVIAFKGAKVSDFGGRSLSLLSSGTMAVDPDITEAHRLKGWYDASGRTDNFATHGGVGAATGRRDDMKLVGQVKEENLGMDGDAYFTVKATILIIKSENYAYPACSTDGCNKKVMETTEGTWRCERCDVAHERPRYRYIMSVLVCDHTGELWLSCFDDTARQIMGMTADELMELSEDPAAKTAAFEKANCRTMHFRVRAKMDTYGEQQRLRYQVMNASPIDFVSEGHKLAETIKQYNLGSD